jgi:GT2 family glycosyltransferase
MIRGIIGVVVIGRNEGDRLVKCLESVKSSVDNIVYVDSGSTDGSIAAAEKYTQAIVTLDLNRAFTAARARNEGFAALTASRSDIRFVQFVDGDCILDPGWLAAAYAFIESQRNIAVVCGRRREQFPSASIYNQLCDIEWDTPVGETRSCGGDSLVRAAAFEAVGGFRPGLIAGEEPELCLRLREAGWKIWRIDAEMTRHDAAMKRFSQWWARSVRGGYAYAEVSWIHRSSPARIWRRETLRTIFWAGLLPMAICVCGLFYPPALAAILVYPLQVCRIAFKRGAYSSLSWTYALFVTMAKFAEFEGIAKFYWRLSRRAPAVLIEYK